MYLGNGAFEASGINQAISLISVPSFMMVCGYFMYSSSWNLNKLWKRELNLIYPFLFWSFTYFILFHSIFYDDCSLLEFSLNLICAPYFCSPLWFFKTLGLITLIAFLCKKSCDNKDIFALVIVFCIINIITLLITKKFAIQSIAGNMGYFIIGYAAHKYNLFNKSYFSILGVVSCAIFASAILLKINAVSIGGGNLIIFKTCNYTGIIAFSWIIKVITECNCSKSRAILYCGTHTLEIYATHFLWVYILMLGNAPLANKYPTICVISYSILVIILSLATAYIVNHIPYIKTFVYGRPTSSVAPTVR